MLNPELISQTTTISSRVRTAIDFSEDYGYLEKAICDRTVLDDEKVIELPLVIRKALAEKNTIESTEDALSSLPPELTQKVVDRINAAVEMGDVMQIKSIAEDLKFQSAAMEPFCNRIFRLVEDFDFDGIKKLVLDLDN